MNYHVSQFGHWDQVKADTEQNRYRYFISNWYIATNANLHIHSSGDAGAVTMSLSESDFYMVISFGRDMQGLKLTGSTCLDCWIFDQSGIGAGGRDGTHLCVCGFCEPSLIWLLPGREVTCSICNFPGTLSRVCRGSLNVVSRDDALSSTIWGRTTATTFNSVVPYFLFLSCKQSAVSHQPGCLNSSSVICFCRKRSMRYCTDLAIVPITHLGSSSSLSLPPAGSSSSSSSSSPSSPSSELTRSLRLSLMAFNISSNLVSGLVVVNHTFSAFLISFCFCLIDVSASSTRFLATAVSLSA